MKIAIPKERRPHETRVAATPETVKKLIALGFDVTVEKSAGAGSAILDDDYKQAGASVAKDAKSAITGADVVLKVQRPVIGGAGGAGGAGGDELAAMKKGTSLICLMAPHGDPGLLQACAKKSISSFAMEMMPRITRAQTMDVLSSQANLAGYKAVVDAAAEFGRAFPMMMTAAGTVPPAQILVLGAGVAGLQAIATGRRLGAVVTATDVRPVVKEQVESLGGKFLVVDPEAEREAETAGGYAKPMSPEYMKKQSEKVAEQLTKTDIAICTALIPGRPAPTLISAEMVKAMRPGSVIVDLAVEAGGNCALSEFGKVVVKHGVTIIGHANVPARIGAAASPLYARNLLNFVTSLVDTEAKALKIDTEDEIVKGTLLTHGGKIVHPDFAQAKPAKAPAKKAQSKASTKARTKQAASAAKKETK